MDYGNDDSKIRLRKFVVSAYQNALTQLLESEKHQYYGMISPHVKQFTMMMSSSNNPKYFFLSPSSDSFMI